MELHVNDAVIGYRYWHVDETGVLKAPVHRGRDWQPGINRARHPGKIHRYKDGCNCGMYAWETGDEYLCRNQYFHLRDGTVQTETESVLGAIILWQPHRMMGGMLRAQHAAIAAIAKEQRTTQERIDLAACRYGVPIVASHDLPAVADTLLRSLPTTIPTRSKLSLVQTIETMNESSLQRHGV